MILTGHREGKVDAKTNIPNKLYKWMAEQRLGEIVSRYILLSAKRGKEVFE